MFLLFRDISIYKQDVGPRSLSEYYIVHIVNLTCQEKCCFIYMCNFANWLYE